MSENISEEKLLAHALYHIRLLLSGFLGSQNQGSLEVRVAAHFAYALHNEALAVIDGKSFDVSSALKNIEHIDQILNVEDGKRFIHVISANGSTS
ncbi:hypothetical protein [Collimonas sp. PA-H2]|uniref:hypothetical protein n=1 Tax=Collimonas sp. PA-H2 TaxID=1881062 RepID=UPI0018ED223D|nr:hypothetical protein [Collimonas sp. PA-H2]